MRCCVGSLIEGVEKMKKRILSLALLLLLSLSLVVPCLAAGVETVRPDWYPEDVEGFVNFYDPDAPLVVDRAGLLTVDQRQELDRKLRTLREKYNCDFVFFSDLSTYGFSRRVYAADFYVFNGHGLGDDFSGMILFVSMEWGNRGWWSAATGSCRSLFTEENINRLDDRLEPYMVDGNYGQGILRYFDDIDRMFATGRAPRPIKSTVIILIVSLALGALAGWITVRSLRGAMTTVKEASNANEYLIPESFVLHNQRDFFLRSTVSRTKIERSSSSGGGGGSSYSGSYSSSSGSSFSGGGRSF